MQSEPLSERRGRGGRPRTPRPFITCACNDHAFVALTKGYVALVDPQDAPKLAARWERICQPLISPPPNESEAPEPLVAPPNAWEMEWRAIETAPRNGARVVIRAHGVHGPTALFARFHHDHWHDDHDIPLELKITHWMPAPIETLALSDLDSEVFVNAIAGHQKASEAYAELLAQAKEIERLKDERSPDYTQLAMAQAAEIERLKQTTGFAEWRETMIALAREAIAARKERKEDDEHSSDLHNHNHRSSDGRDGIRGGVQVAPPPTEGGLFNRPRGSVCGEQDDAYGPGGPKSGHKKPTPPTDDVAGLCERLESLGCTCVGMAEGKPYPTRCPYCDEDYERGHHRTKEAEDNCLGTLLPYLLNCEVDCCTEDDLPECWRRMKKAAAKLQTQAKEIDDLISTFAGEQEQLTAARQENQELREALEKADEGLNFVHLYDAAALRRQT
jgi:hypothetical protein